MIELTREAALVFIAPVSLICLYAAFCDLSTMKLPNRVVITLAAAYVVIAPFVLPFDQYLWGFTHGIAMYFIGMFAFLTMGVGAGDGKFAAAMSLFIPLTDAPFVLIIYGVMCFVALIGHRIMRAIPIIRRATPEWTSWTSAKFPLGLALAGTMITYLAIAAFR